MKPKNKNSGINGLMVKEHTLPTRYLAVGIIEGGMTQAQVARHLGVGLATIRRWHTSDRQGETMENHRVVNVSSSRAGLRPAVAQGPSVVEAGQGRHGPAISQCCVGSGCMLPKRRSRVPAKQEHLSSTCVGVSASLRHTSHSAALHSSWSPRCWQSRVG